MEKKSQNIKKYTINILKYILVFIILICIYLVALIFSSLIPTSWIKNNVIQSSETLKQEGEKKVVNLGYKNETLFLFTDALMINTAYSIDPSNPLESSIVARKNYIPGQTTKVYIDSQYNLGASENYKDKYGNIFQTGELYGLMHGENITDSFEYARYWHGYLTVLRPLLVITNYTGIRILTLITVIILIAVLFYLIYKKIDSTSAIIIFIGLISANIFVATQSMNEITAFIIAIIASIYLLLKKNINKNICINFFIIGSLTNFFDFFVCPIITIGMPIIIYFLRVQKERKSIRQDLIDFIKICIAWACGYGATWVTKWLITAILYNRPIISQSIEQILYRSSIGDNSFSYLDVLYVNFRQLSYMTIIISILGVTLFLIDNMISKYKKKIDFKQNLKDSVPYILISILPFIWYFVAKQHSYIHSFFTHRILMVTIIGILIVIHKLFKMDTRTCTGEN